VAVCIGWRAAQRARMARCFGAWAAGRVWHRHEVRLQEMELERTELHEANSRIATLAFSQAGMPMEAAHQQLMDVLMPHTAARKADERCKQQDSEAAALHAQLGRALTDLASQAERHQREISEIQAARAPDVTRRPLDAPALDAPRSERDDAEHAAAHADAADAATDDAAATDAAAAAAAAAAPRRPTETVAVQCSLFVAEQERQRSAIALEYEAKVAALKQVAALQAELESRGREIEELTGMLIEAKVAVAQQGSEMLERKHEVVQLTTKLEVVEMPELSAQDRITKDRRRSSPGGRSPRNPTERQSFSL